MSYTSFGYAFPAAPIGGGSVGSQQLLHSSRLTSFATNNTGNNSNSNNVLNNADNASLLQQPGPCNRLQLQGPAGTRPGPYVGLHGTSEGTSSAAAGFYGRGLISYPRPVHGGSLPDSVYRTAYAAAAAAAHQGYGPLVAAVDSAAPGTVCYPSLNADGHEAWRTQTTPGGWPYDFNMGVYPYTNSYGGLDVRRKNATRESTSTLKAWLYEHIKNPYPTKGEKIMLAIITKMTLTQVSTWFANARRRLKKENKMQWSPNKRAEEREAGGGGGDDDDDNDDNDNDDDDNDDQTKLNVADDDSQEPLQKLALLKAMHEVRSQADPIKHQNLNLYCVTTTPCVTSPAHPPPPPSHPSSVTHQLASNPHQLQPSSAPSITDLLRISLASSCPSKDDGHGPAKPRIWSLADVATRGTGSTDRNDTLSYPINPYNRHPPTRVVEPHPVRPKFQPWAEDNHWPAVPEVADAGHHHPKLDQGPIPLPVSSSPPHESIPHSGHPPLPPPLGTNVHWSFYRTLSTTAGQFSFASPVSLYLDKYRKSQLTVNAPSIRDYADGTEYVTDERMADIRVLQPVSATEDDGEAERGAAADEDDEEDILGDGDSSIEENFTVHLTTRLQDDIDHVGVQ